MKTKFEKVSLLYDGACYLCNMEMDIYRKKDPNQILDLVDISQPHFDASSLGLSEKEVNLHFHAETWMGNGTKGRCFYCHLENSRHLQAAKLRSWQQHSRACFPCS